MIILAESEYLKDFCLILFFGKKRSKLTKNSSFLLRKLKMSLSEVQKKLNNIHNQVENSLNSDKDLKLQ